MCYFYVLATSIVYMNLLIKYSALSILYLCLCITGYASRIDSLETDTDVERFLNENMRETTIINLEQFAEVYRPGYSVFNPSHIDTYEVYDPIKDELVTVIQPHESSTNFFPADTSSLYQVCSIKQLIQWMNVNPWRFYKEDIDNNGYTDLVIDIDWPGVVVMMDMGNRLLGNLLSDRPDFSLYKFSSFLVLENGQNALELKRVPCSRGDNFLMQYKNKDIIYVTEKATQGNIVKPDTLYKIIRATTDDRVPYNDTNYKDERVYVDTVDMMVSIVRDTIVYRFNAFMKYNNNPMPVNISKIYYHRVYSGGLVSDGCRCIEIAKDGNCKLSFKSMYAGKNEDVFSAILDSTSLYKLWSTLTYIDINSKKGHLAPITHGTGSTFIIFKEDGTSYAIPFWGYKPSMDLGYLSKSISDISKQLDWQPSVSDIGFECYLFGFDGENRVDENHPGDCDWEW